MSVGLLSGQGPVRAAQRRRPGQYCRSCIGNGRRFLPRGKTHVQRFDALGVPTLFVPMAPKHRSRRRWRFPLASTCSQPRHGNVLRCTADTHRRRRRFLPRAHKSAGYDSGISRRVPAGRIGRGRVFKTPPGCCGRFTTPRTAQPLAPRSDCACRKAPSLSMQKYKSQKTDLSGKIIRK